VRKDGRLFAAQVFGGDGLWEIDPAGSKPPRLILKDLGGFNGFDIGADGKLYGPLWFKHQVVRIDPDTGELDVVAEGFDTPAAANFDSRGNLYVLDTARGEVVRVDIRSGKKQVVTQLATALDNLATACSFRTWRTTASRKSTCATARRAKSSRARSRFRSASPLSLKVRATRSTLPMCLRCALSMQPRAR
jgi:sugar lactone lactonase YvrE